MVTDATQKSRTLLYFLKLYNAKVDNHNKIQLNIYESNNLRKLQMVEREKVIKKFFKK